MTENKYDVLFSADPRIHLVKMVRKSDGEVRMLTRSGFESRTLDEAFEAGSTPEEMKTMEKEIVRTEETVFGFKTYLRDGTWVLGRVLPDGSRQYTTGVWDVEAETGGR